MKKKYDITGMSCAACSMKIEKTVSKISGVKNCSVNLLTNQMFVDGDVDDNIIIKTVESIGYGAKSKNQKQLNENKNETDIESKKIVKRLILSLLFLLPLMYITMGHNMLNLKLPYFLNNNYLSIGITEMLLTIIVMIINQKFFVSGFKSIIHFSPNMDTIVALGSSASFIWSVVILYLMSDAILNQNSQLVMKYSMEFYFESAAMILTLITVGKMLESKSKGKTTNAIKGLIELAPKTATIIENSIEKIVNIDSVKKGDIFLVKPGEQIPVDGVVISGSSAVNESSLTGESIPVDKNVSDVVYSGTINQSGVLKCEAKNVGEDTTLSKIIKMVMDASASKAPIAKVADKVSGVFVPVVICISLITFITWMILGYSIELSLTRAVAVLVISCPCALGLATPVAIMVGNGVGAKNGILFKNSTALENAGRVEVVVLDKTGTITYGNPKVVDIIKINSKSDKELLELAYSIEKNSEHPLAKAINNKAVLENIKNFEVSDFKSLVGSGVSCRHNEDLLFAGSYKFISERVVINNDILKIIDNLSNEGKTSLLFVKNNILEGIIAVSDTIKPDSIEAISILKKMGIKTIMLTGDNEKTANAIAKFTGVDEVIANVKPDEKENVIKNLQKKYKVAMVGDGINDALALTRADIGIAIGSGIDIALDASDIVLMKNSLMDIPGLINLSRETLKIIYENLFWAFCYNIIGIPLAAGVFYNIFSWQLTPMFGAAAMSMSSFCVVTNALRLNFVNIYKFKKNIKKTKTEENFMTKKIIVDGMMCDHCKNRVKNAISKISGVKNVDVNLETKEVIIESEIDIDTNQFKNAVEDEGYKFVSIV